MHRYHFVTATVTALLAALVLLTSAPAALAAKVTSTPREGVLSIDGGVTDWDGVPDKNLDMNVRVIRVANDRENLYVSWHFHDLMLAHSLSMRGVTIWIDGDGKKQRGLGVRYRGSQQIATMLASYLKPEGEQGQGPPQGQGFVLPRLELLDGNEVTTLPENARAGVSAASTLVGKEFWYEVRIPFELVRGAFAKASPSGQRELRLGFELGGLTEAESEQMRKLWKSGGGRGGFGGGGMGGGAPGGYGGGMSVDMGKGGMGGPTPADMRPPLGFGPELVWVKVRVEPIS